LGEDAAALTEEHLAIKAEDVTKGDSPTSILQRIIFVAMSFDVPLEVYDIIDLGKKILEKRQEESDPAHKVKPPRRLLHSRVHVLGEAAGKLRPVAIFDAFSQRVLKPLHDDIFVTLKKIKQDGTHSQTRLMGWLKSQASTAWAGFTWSSLDISAATDSIPTILYKILLEELYGNTTTAVDMAKDVIDLMTDRDFTVTVDKSVNASRALSETLPDTIRYTRGQPMGCLGSFALLALWNHSWVQFSSWLVNGRTISSYGVTGDDVVLCEPSGSTQIGSKYVEISNLFGISISLPKSYTSSSLFNFLSRTWYKGEEISPTSLKEDITIRDASSRAQRAIKMLSRDWWNSDGNGWLAKAMKYFLYPSEFVIACSHTRNGKLDGYGLRSVLSFLSPSRSVLEAGGISSVPILSWLSAFAGSTALLAHGDMVRNNRLLPAKTTESSLYGILQDLANSLLRQIIDKYQWNDDCSGSYLEFLEAQNSALQEPGIGCLFLPSEWDFHALHLEDTRWLYPDITEGYTNAELETRLGPLWFEPGNIQSAISKMFEWLEELPTARDFSDHNYFAHQASLWASTRKLGEREFNKFEREALSLVYLATSAYPGSVDISLSTGMTSYLEKKYLNRFLGYTVGDVS
jgi:hypothetical protein